MDKGALDVLQAEGLSFIYGPTEILFNLAVAFVLGMGISYVYKTTHKGLSYSQAFMLSLVFVALIVSMVMMIIGNNVARAFALVGALSIIRFRTVIKDTKDTAYVFLALAAGMAAGTSNYFLAFAGSTIIATVAVVLYHTNYGSLYKSEFILRFRAPTGEGEPPYSEVMNEFARTANLLHVEPSGDGLTTRLTFDILMRKELDPKEFSRRLANIDGVEELVLVASKNDVDY